MADDQAAKKRAMEIARRERLSTEMDRLRRVIDEAEPGLAVPMQQADVLEQARLLICKLQKQAAELEQQLQSIKGDYLNAYNLGRAHMSEIVLAAQLLQLQSQPPSTTETTPPSEDAQME